MLHGEALGLLVGAVALGAVHGIEPGHGWPVAASYALDQSNKWVYGFAASFILGLGHLISSIAMVGVFFYAKNYFELTQIDEPMTIPGGIQVGGPVSIVAGILLIALGIREYTHGHSHGSGHGHDHGDESDHDHLHGDHSQEADHSHDDHDHPHGIHGHNPGYFLGDRGHDEDCFQGNHDHDHESGHTHGDHSHGDHGHGHSHHDHDSEGGLSRLKGFVPFVGGHSHSHGDLDEAAERGLLGIAWFAFLLGFAHEEEFEIIALCSGSNYCLELMTAYALTVIVGIVGLTMLLIAGYQNYEERVEQYTPYLPAFSAAVLCIMGAGFVLGLF